MNSQQAISGTARGAPPVTAEPPRQFLTFQFQGEVFGMGILAIKEIIEYSDLTSVPMMPAYVRGVINLRGAVVPTIDLAIRFGRTASPVTKRTCIVIVEINSSGIVQDVGLVVDLVDSVLEIAMADIEPPPAFGARIASTFIEGMGKVNDRFVILLDVNSMLAPEEAALLRADTDLAEGS